MQAALDTHFWLIIKISERTRHNLNILEGLSRAKVKRFLQITSWNSYEKSLDKL